MHHMEAAWELSYLSSKLDTMLSFVFMCFNSQYPRRQYSFVKISHYLLSLLQDLKGRILHPEC